MWLLQMTLQWHTAATYSTFDAAAATPQQEITAVLDESKLRRESHSLQQVSNYVCTCYEYLSANYTSIECAAYMLSYTKVHISQSIIQHALHHIHCRGLPSWLKQGLYVLCRCSLTHSMHAGCAGKQQCCAAISEQS